MFLFFRSYLTYGRLHMSKIYELQRAEIPTRRTLWIAYQFCLWLIETPQESRANEQDSALRYCIRMGTASALTRHRRFCAAGASLFKIEHEHQPQHERQKAG